MLKYTIRAVIIVDEGSGGDPRSSPMELNVGVNGKNGKYPLFMRKSQNGKGTDKAFGTVMIMTRI